jgi:hypothetical protein
MCFQMGSIDHQLFPLPAAGREFGQNSTEHTKSAPADEAIVNRLVGTVFLGRVSPTQSVAKDKDNATYDPAVVHSRNTVRQWKVWRNAAHLRLGQQHQITHGNTTHGSTSLRNH